MSEIRSMRDDFPAVLDRMRATIQTAQAEARRGLDAYGAQSHPTVRDATLELIGALGALADKTQEIYGISRAADVSRHEVADNPRPSDETWTH